MTYKKRKIKLGDKSPKTSQSRSTTEQLKVQDRALKISSEVQTSAKRSQAGYQEKQKKVNLEKDYSSLADHNITGGEDEGKNDEAIGMQNLSGYDNLANNESMFYHISPPFLAAFISIEEQTIQYTMQMIDAYSDLYIKNIDLSKESAIS